MNGLPRLFDPWVPTKADPRVHGLRLMIVGESHYDDGANIDAATRSGFTREIVERWGTGRGGYQRFFASVYAVVTGARWDDSADDYANFWNSILFYNYVQHLVEGGPGQRPPPWTFAASGEAFIQTLGELRPDAVLVFGEGVWQTMPTENADKTVNIGALGDVWVYQLADGSQVSCAHTLHPSARNFSAANYHGDVARFFDHVAAREVNSTGR